MANYYDTAKMTGERRELIAKEMINNYNSFVVAWRLAKTKGIKILKLFHVMRIWLENTKTRIKSARIGVLIATATGIQSSMCVNPHLTGKPIKNKTIMIFKYYTKIYFFWVTFSHLNRFLASICTSTWIFNFSALTSCLTNGKIRRSYVSQHSKSAHS